MFIPILRFMQRNSVKKIVFFIISGFFLCSYPIYKNYINGLAINTYENFQEVIEGRSKFYNPWQYRILCPFLIEATKVIYDHTVDKVFPIENYVHFKFNDTSGFTPATEKFVKELNDPEIIKYLAIFILFRFVIDLMILFFSFLLLRFFIKNLWLVLLGLIMISWSMGNGVNVSDLSFNTYLDVCLYLITGCLIVYRIRPWLVLPITIIGAFNRETSLLIPFLFFISNISFDTFNYKQIFHYLPSRKVLLISIFSFVAFLTVFVGLRIYFGYRPQTIWKVPAGWSMLRLNTFSIVAIKGYFEMFGVFSILPLICIYKFKRCSMILRTWFLALVPIWFFVHLYSVVDYQSRLFLVPTLLVFLPMLFEIIEKTSSLDSKSLDRNLTSKVPDRFG